MASRFGRPGLRSLLSLALVGCGGGRPDSDPPVLAPGPPSAREAYSMDPADWRNTWARGIDSMPGRLTSSGTDLAIDYDAGGVSTTGDPLTLGVDGDFAWKKSGRIAGEAYACGLDRDSVLWIRFEGVLPGLFWADVDGPGEIAFVLKLLARYRVELIDRTRAGSVEQSPREAGKSEAPAAPG